MTLEPYLVEKASAPSPDTSPKVDPQPVIPNGLSPIDMIRIGVKSEDVAEMVKNTPLKRKKSYPPSQVVQPYSENPVIPTMMPSSIRIVLKSSGPDELIFNFRQFPDPMHPMDGRLALKTLVARGTAMFYCKKHFPSVPRTVGS